MGFADSIAASGKRALTKTVKGVNDVAFNTYSLVIKKTPVGEGATKGQLINNWQLASGIGNVARTVTQQHDITGSASKGQLLRLKTTANISGKEVEHTLTNSVHYAYRAEYFGWNWNTPEPRWKGTKPYGMVRNSITVMKARKGKAV